MNGRAPRFRGANYIRRMTLDRFLVTDQVAIVTGSGRGIGAATAVTLAEAGADVVLAARTEGAPSSSYQRGPAVSLRS